MRIVLSRASITFYLPTYLFFGSDRLALQMGSRNLDLGGTVNLFHRIGRFSFPPHLPTKWWSDVPILTILTERRSASPSSFILAVLV